MIDDDDDFERYVPDVKAIPFDKDHKYEVVKFAEKQNENPILVLVSDIEKRLNEIYDPEIPVDIYELGLIYDVLVNENFEVKILMTLTSPNCPVAESLPQEVQEKVKSIDDVNDCEVEMTFDPPWNKDIMSEEAKLELGML